MKKFLTIALTAAVGCAAMAQTQSDIWPSEVIYQQPTGELHQTYCGSEISWLLYNGGAASMKNNYGICREMVTDGDDVYLKNFLLENKTDSWIKGTKQENGDILFSFPQKISDRNGNDMYLGMLTPSYGADSTLTLELIPGQCDMTMRWEDGVLRQVLPPAEGIENPNLAPYIGMVGAVDRQGNFKAYGEKGMSVKIWTEQPLEAPEFAFSRPYEITYTDRDNRRQQSQIEVNFTESQVWIQGLNKFKPEAWLAGDITADGDWTFTMPQYNGLVEDFYSFFLGVKEDGVSTVDTVVMKRGEDGTLTSTADIIVNIGTEKISPSLKFADIMLAPVEEVSQTPMSVTDLEAEWDSDLGVVGFFLPTTDTEGRTLDMSKLYYNIYLDNELHTFTPENDFVDEEMTDIPANYSNDLTFMVAGDGYILVVLFEPYNTVGVRCVYKNSVATNYSEIVSSSMIGSGIEKVEAGEPGSSVIYYDLNGVRTAKPNGGIFIRRTVNPDGSIRTDKVTK